MKIDNGPKEWRLAGAASVRFLQIPRQAAEAAGRASRSSSGRQPAISREVALRMNCTSQALFR